MTAIIVAIVGLGLTIIGLIVKLTTFNTEIRIWVEEMRKEMHILKRVPMLEYRVGVLEKHAGIFLFQEEKNDEN